MLNPVPDRRVVPTCKEINNSAATSTCNVRRPWQINELTWWLYKIKIQDKKRVFKAVWNLSFLAHVQMLSSLFETLAMFHMNSYYYSRIHTCQKVKKKMNSWPLGITNGNIHLDFYCDPDPHEQLMCYKLCGKIMWHLFLIVKAAAWEHSFLAVVSCSSMV